MKVYKRKHDFTFPEDMKKILDYLSIYGYILIEEATIEKLYYEFCEERYDAGWMCIYDEILDEFENWLNEYEL